MKLSEIIRNIKVTGIVGNSEVEICDIDIDSRKAAPGHLFVAIKGTQTDGHKFIPKAVEQGASAILCEELPEETKAGITYVTVDSTEASVGPVATTFHGNPTEKLKLVGVTGTNGKTTIATLLYNMFRCRG